MTLISYAQNGEDVVLWRALRHVENGFYIDIGACDPDELSVTRLFYDRGWNGINVEPSQEFYSRCVAQRPRDVNLNMAVVAAPGPVRFLNIPGTGLSTTVRNIAEAAAAKGWTVEERQVSGVTLADVCAMAGGSDIHFLKIDVEGGELAVLSGGDFERFRPWIVVVEATIPSSTERSEHDWEPLLLQAGYKRCLFDGLNLYYLAQERAELAQHLTAGANVLDDYVPAVLAQTRQLLEDAQHWGAGLETTVAERDRQLACEREALAKTDSARSDAVAQLDALTTAHNALRTEAERQQKRLREELDTARAALAREAEQAVRLRTRLKRLAKASGQEVPHISGEEDDGLFERLAAHIAWREQESATLRAALADASQRVDAMRQSTSWRITAPVRMVRRMLGNSQPLRRPALPAALAADPSPKEVARQVFYHGMRAALRVPGSQRGARLVRRMAPKQVEWLAARFRAYDQRAAMAAASQPVTFPQARELPLLFTPAQRAGLREAMLDLSEEEARLFRQLSAAAASSTPAAN